ncbi:MAG: cytochrome c biogenesis protein [Nitrospinota bacterium]|nr:cytochrome c biogenesis protein [Nitrospinota bacterium]MDH5757298.1 cytochrome c biogenesis protein [Nitrospinota bacterium]
MNTPLIIATFLFFLGMLKYLLHLALRRQSLFILATIMIALGFAFQTAGMVMRSMETGHGPYGNLFEYCVFSAWIVFGIFLVAEGYYKIKPLGAFMTPVGFLLCLIALILSPNAAEAPVVREYWFTLHRTTSFLAFGAITLVFAASVMYLIQERQLKAKKFGAWYHRLPSLEILDDVNRKGLIVGFPIYTVGFISAVVWSYQKYGSITIHGSTALLILGWLLFAVASGGRAALGWRGRREANFGIVVFAMVAMAMLTHLSK